MRIALFGQADFGKQCLDRLIEAGHEIVGVFAPPDRGRPDVLGALADELGLRVVRRRYFQKKTGEPIPAALEAYASMNADLNVLASVTVFLPHEITDTPKHRSVCFHPSLLPRYRGGSAMHWQIILGERETGVTIFIPDRGVDTGPIVLQKGGVEIGREDTTGTLFFKKLLPLGVDTTVEAVRQIANGTACVVPQNESAASFHPLVDDCVAALRLSYRAREIDRIVRACDPQPGAFLSYQGKPLRLYDARLEEGESAPPGTVLTLDASGLVIALRVGCLRVGRVRSDMSKEPAFAFAERTGLRVGDCLQSGCS